MGVRESGSKTSFSDFAILTACTASRCRPMRQLGAIFVDALFYSAGFVYAKPFIQWEI